jgi:hypothetical protein
MQSEGYKMKLDTGDELLVNFAMRLPLIMKREHQLKQQEFRKVH